MLDKQMRLEDLLGREVGVRWYEGVALIQAVCRQQPGSSDTFPTASEIVIGLDGTVAVLSASGRTAVRTAAQLLGTMLSDDVPVRLRLIVAQATGADTAYPTLSDFSTALAYFERPDATQVLRALVERAMMAPVRAASEGAVPVAAPHEPHPSSEGARDPSRSRAHLRLVVGAALTATCLFAVWLGASAVGYGRLSVALTTLAGVGPSQATAAPTKSKTRAVGTGGGSTAERSLASTKDRPNATLAARPTSGVSAAQPNRPAALKEPLHVAALLPLNPMSRSIPTSIPEFRPVFEETVEITATTNGPDEGIETDGVRIYSKADPGVVPPRSVYPKLPPDPEAVSVPDKRTVLELVVGTNGLVERARLRSIPHDIHEFMLVSAAKAWIFEPATVDGLPVRYRHRVLISFP